MAAAKASNRDQRETVFIKIINDLMWMAARYSHGRQTYAPGMVREAVDWMRKMVPGWEPKKDETIKPPEPDELGGMALKGDYLHDIFNPEEVDLEIEFLSESNKIEGVYDQDSLGQAAVAWGYLKSFQTLTVSAILRTHKLLMLKQPLQPDEKGYFRRVPVWVGGYSAVPWEEIEGAIKQWVVNANDVLTNGKNESKIFLERVIKEQHVAYEKIHPFVDGNGRTGRMFLNWTRLQAGLPILVIKDSEKQKYYSWFK